MGLQRAKEARDSIVIARLFRFTDLDRAGVRGEASTGEQEDPRGLLRRHVDLITCGGRHDLNNVDRVDHTGGQTEKGRHL